MKRLKFLLLLISGLSLLGLTYTLGSNVKPSAASKTDEELKAVQAATLTQKSPQSGEQIKWQVISGGGAHGTSTSFGLSGTFGQTAAGPGSSTNFKVRQGFWQYFAATACNCGDADGSGGFDISDAVFLIAYIFAGGAAPNPICLGDADGSGSIDISDAVYLIAYIFAGGPAPHCP